MELVYSTGGVRSITMLLKLVIVLAGLSLMVQEWIIKKFMI